MDRNRFSFEDIVDKANDIIIVTEADPIDEPGPRIVYVNPAFTELTGYTAEEAIGQNPRILQGEDTDPATRDRIREALARREPIRVEILNYSKSGDAYWLDMNIVPLFESDGEIRYFAAIERDLTERIDAEEALRASEQRFRSTLESMTEGVLVQDRSGRVMSCNPAAERILGRDLERLGAEVMIDPQWHAVHADYSPFTAEDYPGNQTLRTGRPVHNVVLGIQKPETTMTWLSANAEPIFYDGDDSPDAVVSTFHDITARMEADAVKNEFISTVSHELRTPLTSIRGAIGMLNPRFFPDLPEQALDLIDIAQRNCARLLYLINDLLDMEKIASGKLFYSMSRLRMDDIITAALDVNEPYADRYDVHFAFEPPADVLYVKGDEQRLTQVMTNLLSNAAKFSPAGSEVIVSVQYHEANIRVNVCDQGEGIPEGFQSQIFEKFAQATPPAGEKKAGTGLGLAISRAIIEQHGGRIGFYRNHPQGTCFYFDLPPAQA